MPRSPVPMRAKRSHLIRIPRHMALRRNMPGVYLPIALAHDCLWISLCPPNLLISPQRDSN